MARFQAGKPSGTAVAELELLVRTAIFKPATAMVGYLLQAAADQIDEAYQANPGQVRKTRVPIQVQCLFGSFELRRDYYYHEGKKQGHYPADAALGLEIGYTPALAKLLCLEGADETTYLKAQRHLEQTGGIPVSARQIQRVVQRVGGAAQQWQERSAEPGQCQRSKAPIMYVSGDGTGVPMVTEELAGRKGKQSDGKAKTRQVYLGCVFTQHRVDEEGRPVRDWESTTYVSSFKPIDHFGPLLRREALRRGMGSKEHPNYKRQLSSWTKRLLKDKVEILIKETRKKCRGTPQAEQVEQALHYFTSNVTRMQYGTFRAAGYFIGSGVVEAGCKTVIGARCKQSGMFWSESGAENVLALRCINTSRRLDDFWKYRLNAKSASNDCLPLAA
jgi:hypothetical protein